VGGFLQEVIIEGQPEAQTAFRGKDSLTLTGTPAIGAATN
jgi:hypothetical protein